MLIGLAAQPGDDCLGSGSGPADGGDVDGGRVDGGAVDGGPDGGPDAAAAGMLRVGTFNAGLARGWIDHCDARRPFIHEALVRAELDLICLQEYWSARDYVALLKATGTTFGEQHRAEVSRRPGPCTAESLAALTRCVSMKCPSETKALATCIGRSCQAAVREAGPACRRCLVSNTLAGVPVADCLAGSGPSPSDELPAGGVALLSRLPLADRDVKRLDAPLLDRLVLYARLPATPIGEVHAFCTHLTAPLPIDLPGMSPEVNRRQVETLIDYVAEKTEGTTGVTILLGDFNAGPAIADGIDGYHAPHYALLPKAGFSNPFAEGDGPRCTRCNDNPLVGGRGDGGALIDHVLLRRWAGTAVAERIFDEPVPLEGEDTALSDHYGVRVMLRR